MATPPLSRSLLSPDWLNQSTELTGPSDRLDYPERVIQFGSGALLRGFINYFIDQANRQGVFQGRAVVVNNTNSGRGALLNEQDGLFTLCVEGFADGETQQKYLINSSISRALPAVDHWPEVLKCAANPNITVITSNTTEVGITLQEDDDLSAQPPQSFPGKLTAFLYERFKQLGGTAESGLVMLPTELIVNNGSKLRDIVLRLTEINQLGKDFGDWVETHNLFCNTLVDRIVPGEPDADKQQAIEEKLGYRDGLLTVSEVYRFFAIEGDESLLYNKVPFLKTDPGIVVAPDITPYRERKLRILNGGHTISVAAGFLCGLNTVHDCLEDAVMGAFVTQIIHDEIVPSLEIDPEMAREFADAVLDRFRNPFINHQLISITLQYTSKMNMRNGLTFRRYYDKFSKVPERMCAGFAAYLLFTRPVREEDGNYFGEFKGDSYPIRDDAAAYFYERWSGVGLDDAEALTNLVHEVLGHASFWDQDLLHMGDFADRVAHYLTQFGQHGVRAPLQEVVL